MAKDFNDTNFDSKSDIGNNTNSDFGGDFAKDGDVDLNKSFEDRVENGEQSVESLPENRGAVPGTEKPRLLTRGEIGVRYGNPETGEYAAPYDTPPEQLNLPLSNSGERHYFVVTDHDGIPVTEASVADDKGQPTGGTQWDFGQGNPISGYDHRHYPCNKNEEIGEDLNLEEPGK